MKILPAGIPAVLLAAALSVTSVAWSEPADYAELQAQVASQHDAGVKRLQEWIALPSIAAEDRGFPQGPEHLISLLKSVGFQHTEIVETDGKPGVFATLDAGAPRSLGGDGFLHATLRRVKVVRAQERGY